MILTVTLTSGTNVTMINTPLGSRRVNSSLLNITPLVYSTQNGSNVVGEALGEIDGRLLGESLGLLLGDTLGSAEGDAEGQIHATRSL